MRLERQHNAESKREDIGKDSRETLNNRHIHTRQRQHIT
jgi:hypothetical protein